MKKAYRKPVVACTDIEKGEIFSNSMEYKKKISHQGWLKEAEEQGVVRFADEFTDALFSGKWLESQYWFPAERRC